MFAGRRFFFCNVKNISSLSSTVLLCHFPRSALLAIFDILSDTLGPVSLSSEKDLIERVPDKIPWLLALF